MRVAVSYTHLVRLVMGGRDLENNTMEVMRRDTLEKETRSCDGIEEYVKDLLEEIQANIYKKALDYRNSRITTCLLYTSSLLLPLPVCTLFPHSSEC